MARMFQSYLGVYKRSGPLLKSITVYIFP